MASDDKGIINFCTGDIKVPNPDYVEDATETPATIIGEAIVGDSTVANDDTVKPYTIYTATEYTARIAGFWRDLVWIEVQHIINCLKLKA